MKTFLVILILSFVCINTNVRAQPQWKFYIAFEDNTGARDTIWCIWDTLATSTGVDTIYGEQAVQLDHSKFNVFIFNQNSDTTKTSALDSLGAHQLLIEAINYQHPISITWDSTILHQNLTFLPTGYANCARIDNDYFFLVNNSWYQQFDMWIDDHAYAPWYSWASQSQFPMRIYILSDPSIGLDEYNNRGKPVLYPNPVSSFVTMENSELITGWELISLQSTIILKNHEFRNSSRKIDLSGVKPGVYFMKIFEVAKNPKTLKLLKM